MSSHQYHKDHQTSLKSSHYAVAATSVSFDPATTYIFSVFNRSSALCGRFSVSETICFGVEPIHWPNEMSACSISTDILNSSRWRKIV